MTSSELDDVNEEILNQAAHWCMRLHADDCLSDERLAFQRWIQLDPRHAFEYAKMLEVWDLGGQLAKEPGSAKKLLTGDSSIYQGVRKM